MDTAPDAPRRGRRPLVLALGFALALTPAACGTFDGSEGDSSEDPSATTVFRTITVELATTTTVAAAVAGGAAAGQEPQSTLDPSVYEVQEGDFWYGIAEKLNVDVNALWAANNADSTTLLLPGKRLAVPQAGVTGAGGIAPPAAGGGAAPAAAPTSPAPTLAPGSAAGSYQIVPGDYWYGIADKLSVPVDSLLAANGATLDTVLLAGKYLKVPKT